MAVMSPIQYRLSLLKERLFGDREVIMEMLVCYRDKLDRDVQVSWNRDKNDDFIVGWIDINGEKLPTQARSASEFVEMVNDVVYAVNQIPLRYAERLGGGCRLMPTKEEFNKLNNVAVMKSSFNFQSTVQRVVN